MADNYTSTIYHPIHPFFIVANSDQIDLGPGLVNSKGHNKIDPVCLFLKLSHCYFVDIYLRFMSLYMMPELPGTIL